MPFYAVAHGRVPGIYESWQECCNQVHKFKSAKYKKFSTKEEAAKFICLNRQTSATNNNSIKKVTSTSNELPLNSLAKSTQFPSLTSIASTMRPASSLESVIVDQVIRKQANLYQKRNLSSAASSNQIEETIVLSDEEEGETCTSKVTTEKEDSVILLEDDDFSSPIEEEDMIIVKQNSNNRPATRTSPRKKNESEAQQPKQCSSKRSRIGLFGDFIPLLRATQQHVTTSAQNDEENRPENTAAHQRIRTQNTLQPMPPSTVAQEIPRNRGHVVVYTDGACTNNGRPNARAGIGVWWGNGDPRNVSEPLTGRQTNNRAEILAAVRAINQAADDGYDSITVCSDSDFMIKCAQYWVYNWRKNGWLLPGGKKVANKDDFEELLAAMERIKVVWEKVKSHIGIPGNEAADTLATQAIGVNMQKNSVRTRNPPNNKLSK